VPSDFPEIPAVEREDAKMKAVYVFETQNGRAFYQGLRSVYDPLCRIAIDEAVVEAANSAEPVKTILAGKIEQLLKELPYNYPIRGIDVRHFVGLAEDANELRSVAVQIATALLQNVGTGSQDSKAKRRK
jgi:hypothetical protein